MAMFSTPKQAPPMMQPSVFFTPPFSSSKPLYYSPIMRMQFSPALPLPFPSPAATPTPEQKDIPSELYLGGYPMVSEKVYSLASLELTYTTVCKCARHGISKSPPTLTSWLKSKHTGGSAKRMQRTCRRVRWDNH